MKTGIMWNGGYYVRPQAASRIDSSELSPVQLGSANKLCILGEMTGLVAPKTLQRIDSTLANTLLDPACEEARLAAKLAFNPSPGKAGATEVYLLPVNPSLPAALTLSNVIAFGSYLYGVVANQVKVKVENATTKGKKVTVAFQSNKPEIHDDIFKDSFSIQYTGAGGACTMNITPTAAGHVLTSACAGAAADNLNIDFTVYPNIQAVLDAINATGKYTAVAITGSPSKDLAMQLDGVAAQDIKAAPYSATANLQAMVDRINERSAYLTAARAADATAPPANAAWTYLAGGANGVTTNNDWQAAFDLLKTVNIQLIAPLSSSAAIHAMGDAHCVYKSGPGKSERRQFVGGPLQAWLTEANRTAAKAAIKAAIAALNSDRTVHATLGCKQFDPDGNIKLYPAYITAVLYAGIAAGASVQTPLTRQYLNVQGLEVELRDEEIDEMLEAHAAAPIPDLVNEAGYVISRQLTTWQQDGDLYRIEFSMGRGADYVAKEVRTQHEILVGKAGTKGLATTLINVTNGVLKAALDEEIITEYDPKATVMRADGVSRYIDYSATPTLPVNFIFSTYHLKPTKYSISL